MALEAARVGNVEVRPVAEVETGKTKLDGRDLNGRRRAPVTRAPVTKMVSNEMVVGKPWSVAQLARALRVKKTSVHTALTALIKRGEVAKKQYGVYERVVEAE